MTIKRLLINQLYHVPKGYIRTLSRFGPLNYFLMKKGMVAMEKHSSCLTFSHNEPNLEIHFLTGAKFLYQTLFCIYSLEKQLKQAVLVHLYDDGSFTDPIIGQIRKTLPNVIIHTKEEIKKRIEDHLPSLKFPYLNHKRLVYPHIKKLTDIHCGTKGWKLVLDSDMLFFNEPVEITNWLQTSGKPLYMLDSDYAYGFPKAAMEKLCGKHLADFVNVGVIGLNSSDINWQDVEFWAQSLENEYGNSYYLEQCLTAMIIGDKFSDVLPKDQYQVYPKDIVSDEVKLRHYVDLSKAAYFRSEWKKLL